MYGVKGVTQFGDYISPVGKICVVSDQCSLDYMEWFYMISHPFITLAQPGDTPSVPPVQQYDTFVEPDVHQQLVAAVAPDEADVNVHRPGHAVVIYFFGILCFCLVFYFITNNCYFCFFFTNYDGYVAIADKLERLLNLRILTKGTEAYTVAKECLSIARSYIGQSTIGHRSRHRRRTDDR